MRIGAVGAAAAAGAGLALQARVNGGLGARLGDGIAASALSTVSGIAVLLALVPSSPAGRRALRRVLAALRAGSLRWWQCCGGLSGALFVAGQGVAVGSLGVGVFTVAAVGGTSAGSLAVDRWGIGPGGRRPVTPVRVAGALACVGAVGLASRDRLGGGTALGLVVLPVLAGAAVAVQSALNGRVGAVAGSPWAATLINFMVAGTALVAAWVVELVVRGAPRGEPPATPWLYTGGLIGIGVIVVAVAVVPRVGVLVFGLASVAGQLLGAVALDTLSSGSAPAAATWVAVAITLAAVALVVRPAAYDKSATE